ncbi:MAG TPA: hypothetical protein VJ208_01515 [Candidatus Nanoarchaeia archaeon]|nr:hypothetical protein [Candidatus Nanoarchaeia archaeon]
MHLSRQLNREPREIIFIDNNVDYVLATKRAGVDAIHFRNIEQLKEELTLRDMAV